MNPIHTSYSIYLILFKAQEYLCLTIFEEPMIQTHDKTILSIEFKSMIKAHGLNPWRFICPKPNSHWQHQSPIGNIKTQFSSALLKAQANYLALFIESPRLSILGKYYIIIISLKSPIINNTLDP